MIENILQNDGLNIALSGIIVVFAGLILIAVTIHLFNKFFEKLHRQTERQTAPPKPAEKQPIIKKTIPLTDEELVVIATAIECYRRIHFETLQSQITFKHGEQQSAWKSGQRFGQRLTITRKL
ncbi:MAG TPA: hypothetical protein ENN20_10095 [Candidatus Marinimicrobia bacterium]|nr:hypothetical protein [Candidatus Neomarinimicrobiota bacterium]